jgi:transposase
MPCYGGMDVSASDGPVCVIDDNLSLLVPQKVRNELPSLITLIEPFTDTLQSVVESPFKWSWLVDGLQEAGSEVCLAQTLGLYRITGAKVKTERRDAWAWATRLKAGMIPQASSSPQATRPIRDLRRQRSRLVARRAAAYGSLRRLLRRHGLLAHSRHDLKATTDEALRRWFAPPLVRLHGQHARQRIDLSSQPRDTLASPLLATGQDRPEFRRLLTIPGLGKLLAMTIVDEIGAVARVQTARACASYCRLVPGVAQAGPVSRRGRHAKQGSPHLQWAFSQAALSAVRYDPKGQRCFDRHLARPRGKPGTLIAYEIIAHQLAQAVYHVLRDGAVYREA